MNSVHGGHRQRMRNRLEKIGGRGMETYELLEMLLYYTVPQKDTNPIAKALLERFGSLDGVLSATKEELLSVSGIGERSANLIIAVGNVLPMCASEDEVSKSTFETYEEIGEYLVEYFKEYRDEVVVMLSFDNSMKLLSVDEVYRKNYGSAGVRPDAFISLAIRRGASAAVVAHNHMYGAVAVSDCYRQTNLLLSKELAEAGIDLLEVYIVVGSKYSGSLDNDTIFRTKAPAIERFIRSKRGKYELSN